MSEPKPDDPYWTPEKREEHRVRGVAHQMCLGRNYANARILMKEKGYAWPPFPRTPDGEEARQAGRDKSELLRSTARENGKLGGRPPGIQPEREYKKLTVATPADTDKLIEHVASAMMEGNTALIKSSPALNPVSLEDRKAIQRLAQIPAEEFNSRLVEKLGILGDMIADRLKEKVEKDLMKTGELSFALVATLQQRANLDGRASLANANIAVQINNFAGPKSREAMIRSLDPNTTQLPPEATSDPEKPPHSAGP